MALIYKAIIEVYLSINILLSKNPQFKHPYMLFINIIPTIQTFRFNLRPIIIRETFIFKTYKILN